MQGSRVNNENTRSGAHHTQSSSHLRRHIFEAVDAHSLILLPWSSSKILRVQTILLTHRPTRAEQDSGSHIFAFI